MNIENVISQLERQRSAIDRAISALREIGASNSIPAAAAAGAQRQGKRRKRHMSAEGRKRIAEAARKRWAEMRAGKASPRKRRLSAEGRRRIVEATKRRWAAVRAAASEAVSARKPTRKAAAKKTSAKVAAA